MSVSFARAFGAAFVTVCRLTSGTLLVTAATIVIGLALQSVV